MDFHLNEIPNSQLHKQSKYYRTKSKLNIMTSYLPKFNNGTTKAGSKIIPKEKIRTQEHNKWLRYGVYASNPKQTSQPTPVLPPPTLSKQMPDAL